MKKKSPKKNKPTNNRPWPFYQYKDPKWAEGHYMLYGGYYKCEDCSVWLDECSAFLATKKQCHDSRMIWPCTYYGHDEIYTGEDDE